MHYILKCLVNTKQFFNELKTVTIENTKIRKPGWGRCVWLYENWSVWNMNLGCFSSQIWALSCRRRDQIKEKKIYNQIIYLSNQGNVEYSQNGEGKETNKTED